MNICDSHTDFLTEISSQEERFNYVKSIKKYVKTISSAVFTSKSDFTIKDVENFKNELDFYNKVFKTKFLFSIEDLGFVKTKKDFENLLKLKPFSITLTWNFKNQFAGGAHTNFGLTNLGKSAIKPMEENNILVDTAHLSKRAFYQIAKFSTKPIYNSHSNIFALHKHKRNLTDKQIQKIVDSDGFLGITIYDEFVAGRKIDAKDVALQFDYLIKKFGYKNFGFGSDLFGISSEHLPQNISGYKDFKKIAYELKCLGYKSKVIKSLMYKNFENFVKKQQKQSNLNKF